jgi:hypothetical protein
MFKMRENFYIGESTMRRRDFLKLIALSPLVGLLPKIVPKEKPKWLFYCDQNAYKFLCNTTNNSEEFISAEKIQNIVNYQLKTNPKTFLLYHELERKFALN